MQMSIDVETPFSPGWWLQTLGTKLHERRAGIDGRRRFDRTGIQSSKVRPGLDLISDYLRGDPPLREDIHSTWATQFRQFLRNGRLHLAPLAVSATANRLGIRDFRTAAADDELGDVEARNLMRRNDLKVKVREVHDYALGLGDGYTLITPPDARRPWSLITSESPMNCITAHDPQTGAEIAALKMFRDDWDTTDFAYLFLPGELWVAKAEVQATTLWRRHFRVTPQWDWDVDAFDDVPNNRVAMVRFRNKDGVSEIEQHLDHLDRINDKLFNEWWIGKIQAFRQRAIQVADDDDDVADDEYDSLTSLTDEELSQLFMSAPDAMWQLPKGAKIWESSVVDLSGLLNSVKAELQWAAAAMTIPLHTITPDAAQGSAEGASLQRENSVDKAADRRDRFDGSWARTMSLGFEFQGMADRADVAFIEALWGPLERYSLSQKADAAAKLWGKVPDEVLWTDYLQHSPADVVERLRPLRRRQLLYGGAPGPGTGTATPPPQAPGIPAPPGVPGPDVPAAGPQE